MRRLSGRFYKRSWRFWAMIGRRIRPPELRLSFLAIYGPLSVMLLLVIWAVLAVVAFALIYRAGSRDSRRRRAGRLRHAPLHERVHVLDARARRRHLAGLARPDVHDLRGGDRLRLPRSDHHLHAAARPGLRIARGRQPALRSRAGDPPSAIRLLRRYAGTDQSEVLRGNLREGERWMADILQSHLSHPVLCFYRAQHHGQSWLVSLTTLLDTCALLIVGGEGLAREQARLTYRMGLLLLADLTSCPGAFRAHGGRHPIDRGRPAGPPLGPVERGIALRLGPAEGTELVRINRRYDVYLRALSRWLMITLPPWIPPAEGTLDGGRIGKHSSLRSSCAGSRRQRMNRLVPSLRLRRENRAAMQITPTTYSALSAMITPAIFLTANASLIISTSNRVSRVVDRIRVLNDQADKLDRGVTELDFPRSGWSTSTIRCGGSNGGATACGSP